MGWGGRVHVHEFILGFRIQWCCSHCKNPYNRDVIEQSLIESVNRKSMAFILQDLVCSKCHGVSSLKGCEWVGLMIIGCGFQDLVYLKHHGSVQSCEGEVGSIN